MKSLGTYERIVISMLVSLVVALTSAIIVRALEKKRMNRVKNK